MPHKNIENQRDWARKYRITNRDRIRKYAREYQAKLRAERTEEEKNKYNLLQKSYRDKKRKTKIECKVCGDLFYPSGNFKTCSDKCRKINRQAINRKSQKKFLQNHPDYIREKYIKQRGGDLSTYRPRNKNSNLTAVERARIWIRNNRERYNKSRREHRKKNDYKNSDSYFKYIFTSGTKISAREVPQELLESYKLYLQLKRKVQNVKTSSI